MERVVKTSDVFKTSRGLPLNYVTRSHTDQRFIDSLTEDSHLVIHGSSKQGKTSLRKSNLQEEDYIDLTCSNNWDLQELHISILKEAGYAITVSESKTIKGKSKIRLKFELPFIGGGTGDVAYEKAKQVNKKNLELDPSDVNDVIRALNEVGFDKYVVIEDFHYLPEETQVDFAVALKAFHEASDICFIIVGVWLEEDRLTVHNGDLTGRVISINADLWTPEDLDKLFYNSESLLNISFSDTFKTNVKINCNGSVFLVQQLCHKACKALDISSTCKSTITVGNDFDIKSEIKTILDSQNSRYLKFITEFSAGFDQTELELYKWILFAIITVEISVLEKGFAAAAIRRTIETKHPQKSNVSHKKLVQALRKSVDLQVKSRIQPIVFEFDANTTRVKVVDRSFILWLSHQKKEELYEYADLTDELRTEIVTEI
ncbi:hypothetical protein [Thalassomonas actiniarum]|uniref:Uncharacterized protein n=1 Tax=Thalassomonas actiniarum TaxID=485447 RepID=A0AAE9YSP5_9GAMM|nr:hypothetical protein [Thalassomonas actiniarum]WDE00127.1 hypothetical protein SG35_005590 [Thalassomonas actiniarum]